MVVQPIQRRKNSKILIA